MIEIQKNQIEGFTKLLDSLFFKLITAGDLQSIFKCDFEKGPLKKNVGIYSLLQRGILNYIAT